MNASENVLNALQIVVAAIGYEPKAETIAVIANELANYPDPMVLGALERCKRECKYRLALADVLERMDDGHLDPDEAWAIVPKSERESAVLTQEIMSSIPIDLIHADDLTAARMAFRESYGKALARARSERRLPRWFPSLGTDASGRDQVLMKAQELGRLSVDHVAGLLQELPKTGDRSPVTTEFLRLSNADRRRLALL